MWSPTEGLPPAAYFEAAYPGFSRPDAKLGTDVCAAGHPCRDADRRAGRERLGLRRATWRSRSATSTRSCRCRAPGVEQPGDVRDRDRDLDLRHGASAPTRSACPASPGSRGTGSCRGCTATRPDRRPSATCSRGSCARSTVRRETYERLEQGAAAFGPGETGLLALDWFNGNRSILADADLTGAIFGLTLQSSPDQIYRALLESIAFGNRRIIDNFTEHGIALDEIVACGGIAERSPLTMQLIADTSGLPVTVPASGEVPARGAALFGAVAAGVFDEIGAAVRAASPPTAHTYLPDGDAFKTYDRVYAIYRELYETLGSSPVAAAARAQADRD